VTVPEPGATERGDPRVDLVRQGDRCFAVVLLIEDLDQDPPHLRRPRCGEQRLGIAHREHARLDTDPALEQRETEFDGILLHEVQGHQIGRLRPRPDRVDASGGASEVDVLLGRARHLHLRHGRPDRRHGGIMRGGGEALAAVLGPARMQMD
jgi:hypothetical protein